MGWGWPLQEDAVVDISYQPPFHFDWSCQGRDHQEYHWKILKQLTRFHRKDMLILIYVMNMGINV